MLKNAQIVPNACDLIAQLDQSSSIFSISVKLPDYRHKDGNQTPNCHWQRSWGNGG
jgi:hypothetical protein